MPHRKWSLRISDILESIKRIFEYTQDMDFEQFKTDTKTIDAVVRNFEIVGEAASHIPEEISMEHPEIPWGDMRDMRNILAHEYFGINEKIVWNTIQDDLPPLVPLLQKLLDRHGA
ncbi:MAG: DUF86 domain-containing protein [Desulfobacteraceae bacterium]|nr:DUF86 domain-containing protein [Desulfobacteraceae bacterium]